MKRLTFLTPDLPHAETVVSGLREMGISDEMMHVVAEDHEMLEKAHLHEATEMETSELESDLNWGLVAGGTLGLLLGFLMFGTVIMGFEFGTLSLLIMILAGTLCGGWIGKMIGESTPNADLMKYQHAMEAGQILMMVDVQLEQMPEVYKLVRRHCPKALIESSHLFHDHPLAA